MQEILTAADAAGDTPRARAARLVASAAFQRAVVALILLNAVTLGLETSEGVMEAWGGALHAIDRALLWIFTAELALRAYAFRGRFLRDPWGVFDLVVVGIAWVPATGAFSVLRALRVLRVLRLISAIPSLRHVVEAMLAALPGMGSIILLMALLFYVFAVMATKLYAGVLPEKFGTLGDSLFTLFQLMTMEDWMNGIVNPVMEHRPWAWLFFIPFIVISTFVVLNLFIGVIVESIQSLREQRESADAAVALAAADAARTEAHTDQQVLLREIRALRAEVAALRGTAGAAGHGRAADAAS
jgi:voltage-gated sodium channel